MRLFVCYSTRDGLIDRLSLQKFLVTLPLSVRPFIDLLHNDWPDVQERIEMEIANCDLFLGLKSPAFLASPWVHFELETAKKFQKEIFLLDISSGISPFTGSFVPAFQYRNLVTLVEAQESKVATAKTIDDRETESPFANMIQTPRYTQVTHDQI